MVFLDLQHGHDVLLEFGLTRELEPALRTLVRPFALVHRRTYIEIKTDTHARMHAPAYRQTDPD